MLEKNGLSETSVAAAAPAEVVVAVLVLLLLWKSGSSVLSYLRTILCMFIKKSPIISCEHRSEALLALTAINQSALVTKGTPTIYMLPAYYWKHWQDGLHLLTYVIISLADCQSRKVSDRAGWCEEFYQADRPGLHLGMPSRPGLRTLVQLWLVKEDVHRSDTMNWVTPAPSDATVCLQLIYLLYIS